VDASAFVAGKGFIDVALAFEVTRNGSVKKQTKINQSITKSCRTFA
jgi:hypothetical protein